jgi:prepilin signal peptidase PulO-like enzyme (type II secretory pathway)
MILAISFLWGSFFAAMVSRGMAYINFHRRHPQLTPTSYFLVKRFFYAYFLCGRSCCEHCKTGIPWQHNIPLLSYLWLRGRCVKCGHPIPLNLWVWECFFLIYGLFLYTWIDGIIWQVSLLFLASLLLSIAIFDYQTMLIPDILSYLVLWLGIAVNTLIHHRLIDTYLYGIVLAYTLLKILQIYYFLGRRQEALGDADPLLVAAIAAWIGVYQLPYYLMVACVFTIILALFQKKPNISIWQQQFPFGPALALTGLGFILRESFQIPLR